MKKSTPSARSGRRTPTFSSPEPSNPQHAQARIAELEKDCDRLERNWNEAMATHRNIAELEQQLAEARKDAERRLDLVERVRKYPENIDHKGSLLWGDILREVERAAIKEQT